MTNSNNCESFLNIEEQKEKKISTTILIITSVNGDDDDERKIISRLTPAAAEALVVNLNNKNLVDTHSIINNSYKRSLLQLV